MAVTKQVIDKRPDFLDKTAQKADRQTEEQDGQGKGPRRFLEGKSHVFHDGLGEDAPGIDTADTEVEPHGRQGDEPAISFHLDNTPYEEPGWRKKNTGRLGKNM